MAVILGQQVDQQCAFLPGQPDIERQLTGCGIEVVDEDHRVVAPVIANGENRRIRGRQQLEVPPADLGHFLAHPDDPLGPVEQRVRIAALLSGVHVLVAVWA